MKNKVKAKKIRKVTKQKEIDVQEEIKDEISDIDEEINNDEESGSMDVEKMTTDDPELKQKKTGVVYFSMIPPKYNVTRIREYFEKVAPGEIGRIYLTRNKNAKSVENRYSEGWMELKRKKVAKAIAEQVDNTQIGGKSRDYVSSMYWNIRYLSGFKWVHLIEQLQFEKEVEKRRMNVEIAQARRIAAHFEEQIEKGKHLRKLEEKVKSAGGKWSAFERDVQQKKSLGKNKKTAREKTVNTESSELMNMIFA